MVGIPKRLLADAAAGDVDALYRRLVRAHEGLSPGASEILNARLVLILASMLGDERRLQQAIAEAMEGLEPDAPRPPR